MKDEKKYYTPTIEEFHVGFEYEHCFYSIMGAELDSKSSLGAIEEWRQRKFSEFQQLSTISELKTRVKYLDREDIESLGWEIKQPYNKKCETFYFTNSNIENEPYIEMDVYEDSKVYINNADYYECHKCFFSGTIRNKSELRRLMRQLGILDYNKEGDGKK